MSHSEFRVFKGPLQDFDKLKGQIESFVTTNKVSARSIGIEFIERTKEVLMSLGYAADAYTPVTLNIVNLGMLDLNDTEGIARRMSEAARQQRNVICHEHCVTDTNEFHMVFMSQAE